MGELIGTELEEFLKNLPDPIAQKPGKITSRSYIVVVRKGEEIVETFAVTSMRAAREWRAENRKNGLRSDIIENKTNDEDGNEITFHPRNFVPEIKGTGGFGTPEITDWRNKSRNFQVAVVTIDGDGFSNAEVTWKAPTKKQKSKITCTETIVNGGYRNKNSALHSLYVSAMKKGHFVIRQSGQIIFRGLKVEAMNYVKRNFTTREELQSLDISFVKV